MDESTPQPGDPRSGDTELIFIADAGGDLSEVVEALRGLATVTQLLPPRLALARAEDGASPQIRGATCYQGEVPPEVLAGLTSPERLFVAAARAHVRQKPRPGDRSPWDTPGFTPPGLPSPPPAGRL